MIRWLILLFPVLLFAQEDPTYPIVEMALCVTDAQDLNTGERIKRWDIVGVRMPTSGVGRKERKNYLWIRVEGLSKVTFRALEQVNFDSTAGVWYDQRRYCIPFHRIKAQFPAFDLTLAVDSSQVYQPFLPVDSDGPWLWLPGQPPLNASGLIVDKKTGLYIE